MKQPWEGSLKGKMIEMQIKDFSEAELSRVFGEDSVSVICIRGAKMMIKNGLTIDSLYKEAKHDPAQNH